MIIETLTCKIDRAMANVTTTPKMYSLLGRIDKIQMCIWNPMTLTQRSSVEQRS